MIISVYWAKNAGEIWDFDGEYEEEQEPGSGQTLLYSLNDPDLPVVILYGPGKNRLDEACKRNPADNDEISAELAELHRSVKKRLGICDIPEDAIDKAEIRLFIHFGAQSLTDLDRFNEILAKHRDNKFQCFSVSRYNGVPRILYHDDAIFPPRKKEKIDEMCKEIGGAGSGSGCEHLRALCLLCQAVAALPEGNERNSYLRGNREWWLTGFGGADQFSESEKAIVDSTPLLKDLIDKINTGDISDINLNLVAEVIAQQLRGN